MLSSASFRPPAALLAFLIRALVGFRFPFCIGVRSSQRLLLCMLPDKLHPSFKTHLQPPLFRCSSAVRPLFVRCSSSVSNILCLLFAVSLPFIRISTVYIKAPKRQYEVTHSESPCTGGAMYLYCAIYFLQHTQCGSAALMPSRIRGLSALAFCAEQLAPAVAQPHNVFLTRGAREHVRGSSTPCGSTAV